MEPVYVPVICGIFGLQEFHCLEFAFGRARAALHPPFFAPSINRRSGESVGVGSVGALVFGEGVGESFLGCVATAYRRSIKKQCLCRSAGTSMPRARAINAQRGEKGCTVVGLSLECLLKITKGTIMVPVLIVCVAIGALFGLCRSRIAAVAPLILLIAAAGSAKWISSAQYSGVAIGLLAAIIVPQICYVIGGYLATRAALRSPVAVRASQAAIGNHLHELYAAPREVPNRIAKLLEQMNAQQSRAAMA